MAGRTHVVTEPLEPRRLFSLIFVPPEPESELVPRTGVYIPPALTISGTEGDDVILLSAEAGAEGRSPTLVATVNGVATRHTGGVGVLTVAGGGGDDVIEVVGDLGFAKVSSLNAMSVQLQGGPGDDVLRLKGGDDGSYYGLEGGEGDDLLVGTARGESLYGGTGRDRVLDGGGNDVISRDGGRFFSASGATARLGRGGVLRVRGSERDDSISVRFRTGVGLDPMLLDVTLNGRPFGFDPALAGGGGFSRVVIAAAGGNDLVQVDANVPLRAWVGGGAGNDLLFGGSGDDVIVGGTGDDRLSGAGGGDRLLGGGGADAGDQDAADPLRVVERPLP